MGMSAIGDAVCYRIPFRLSVRVTIFLAGAVVSACLTGAIIHIGYENASSHIYQSLWAFVGLIVGAMGCRFVVYRCRLGSLRVYWTGIECNQIAFSRWYSWTEVVALDNTTIFLKDGRHIDLGRRVFSSRDRERLPRELAERRLGASPAQRIRRWATQKEVVGSSVGLRPWCAGDWSSYRRIMAEPSIRSAHDYGTPSWWTLRQWFRGIVEATNSQVILVWHFALENLEGDHHEVCGHVDVWLTDPTDGVVEVAYGILPHARRRGLMNEALRLVVAELRGRPDIQHVDAHVYTQNMASISLLSGLGFKRFERVGGGAGQCRYRFTDA